VGDAGALAQAGRRWLTDPDARARASEQAFIYIERQRGAAERTARLLDPFIESRSRA
jgi:hypothetical protein